jgi:hypothetical protein
MAHNQLASKYGRYQLRDLARSAVRKSTTGPRVTASPRNTARRSTSAGCRFRLEQRVYNRDTKEQGLVRDVYKKDGVIMYKAWLPAAPRLLHWGHFVSDWAEGVLERVDEVLLHWDRFPNSR